MPRQLTRSRATVVASAAVLVLVAGTAIASNSARGPSGASQVITACVSVKTGVVRIPSAARPCVTEGARSIRERVMTWNQQGVPGTDGEDGAAGATGATGATGAAGADGQTGVSGPTGPSGAPGSDGSPGSAGPSGPSGAPGSTGPSGPPGPAGSGAFATLEEPAIPYCLSGDLRFDTAYPDPLVDLDNIAISEPGVYLVSYDLRESAVSIVHDAPSAVIAVNGSPLPATEDSIPVDAFPEGDRVSGRTVVDLDAGDRVSVSLTCAPPVAINAASLIVQQLA
jgi:hypothetical protein